MKKIKHFVILLVLALSLSACGEKPEATIIVAGSTSVQPYAEILAQEYQKTHKNIEINVQGGGSSAGITAAQTRTAEIGMSSRNLKAEEELWSVEIAKDGLAIIVHPTNPVSSLSLKQIQGIYSGEITNWQQVGGNNAKIHIITREDGSGTRSAFEDLVMGKDHEISPKAIVQDSNGTVKQLVVGDKNAIGFISLGLVDHKVKALDLEGVDATLENVLNGTYTLYRPFLFVCEKEPKGAVKDFIEFVLSEEGKQILINEGLIPE